MLKSKSYAVCVERKILEAIRQILIQLYDLKPLPRGVNKLVRETIFILYEGGFPGKWSFERPHSAAARALHRHARSEGVPFNGKRFQVTYDHAIPLGTLSDGLRNATCSYEKLRDFLLWHVQGVVILKKENAKLSKCGLRKFLPPRAQGHDMLARYRKAKIKLKPEDDAKLKRRISK
ncbi:MAG TPA: hypothetical protein VG028_12295 [Terriglobia bacterium]|nr:hypothetical protein [Terriglobia bacterium]